MYTSYIPVFLVFRAKDRCSERPGSETLGLRAGDRGPETARGQDPERVGTEDRVAYCF